LITVICIQIHKCKYKYTHQPLPKHSTIH